MVMVVGVVAGKKVVRRYFKKRRWVRSENRV